MIWRDPQWFWALLIIPFMMGVFFFRWFTRRRPTLLFSALKSKLPGSWRTRLFWLPDFFLWIGVGALILGLARPQLENVIVERKAEGIDIIMVLDISTSMLAEDLLPNRFESAKNTAISFIRKRISDRIGLVIFAGQSYTVCPPTLDYNLLTKLIQQIQMGVVEDGTAIGMGLATAVNRLKDSKARSKVIILLTDGQNNAGEIDPGTAADLAVTYGIKIYSIGAGTKGMARYPIQDPIFGKRYQNMKVDIDEPMLISMAQMTGGKYYRATDSKSLQAIYDEIDSLEKTKVDELIYTDYQELYEYFLLPALALLAFSMLLSKTLFRLEYS
jgi:Ca-activated chloride channel family protein